MSTSKLNVLTVEENTKLGPIPARKSGRPENRPENREEHERKGARKEEQWWTHRKKKRECQPTR